MCKALYKCQSCLYSRVAETKGNQGKPVDRAIRTFSNSTLGRYSVTRASANVFDLPAACLRLAFMFATTVFVCSPRLPEWLAGWLACSAYPGKRDAGLRGGAASNEIGQQQNGPLSFCTFTAVEASQSTYMYSSNTLVRGRRVVACRQSTTAAIYSTYLP